MKKLAILLALLIIPCSAFGLETLTDNAMDGITGQAGVSMAPDDIQLFLNIEKLAYIDCDGFESIIGGYGVCSGGPGAVALNNFQLDVVNINAIVAGDSTANNVFADNAAAAALPLTGTDGFQGTGSGLGLRSGSCGYIPLFYQYATDGTPGCTLWTASGGHGTFGLDNYNSNEAAGVYSREFRPRFLTIDVSSELPVATAVHQFQYAGTATTQDLTIGGVLIGLPTVEIFINELIMTPVFDADVDASVTTVWNDDDYDQDGVTAGVQAADYGTIYMKDVTFTVLNGWIEVAPH